MRLGALREIHPAELARHNLGGSQTTASAWTQEEPCLSLPTSAGLFGVTVSLNLEWSVIRPPTVRTTDLRCSQPSKKHTVTASGLVIFGNHLTRRGLCLLRGGRPPLAPRQGTKSLAHTSPRLPIPPRRAGRRCVCAHSAPTKRRMAPGGLGAPNRSTHPAPLLAFPREPTGVAATLPAERAPPAEPTDGVDREAADDGTNEGPREAFCRAPMRDRSSGRSASPWARGATRWRMGSRSDPVADGLRGQLTY